MQWFKNNGLILNEDKCKLLILSKQEVHTEIHLGSETITNSKIGKLLGITIDHKLKFNEHVNNLCKKANQKLHAFSTDIKLYVQRQIKIYYESFYNFAIWLLSYGLDVSQQKT